MNGKGIIRISQSLCDHINLLVCLSVCLFGTDSEQSISRTLEIAQSRVAQLVAELEATKEAQMIVLETKEAVMRSLARQNSQLSIEVEARTFDFYVFDCICLFL